MRFKATRDRIMTLGDLCDFVAGRATLVIELKSHFDGDRRLVQRSADVLANYRGPVAVMSFDPAMIEVVRWIAPHLTRGIVAERHYAHHDWDRFPRAEKRGMAMLLHAGRTRPHFIAYGVKDLPAAAPLIARATLPLAAADLDRAVGSRPPDRGALGRPDDIRGPPPVMAEWNDQLRTISGIKSG